MAPVVEGSSPFGHLREGRVAELVDARDSKFRGDFPVRVRFPPLPYATLAQLVEHWPEEPGVSCSSQEGSTTFSGILYK